MKSSNSLRKEYRWILILLCSIFTTIAFSMNYDLVSEDIINSVTGSSDKIYRILMKLIYSVDKFGTKELFMTLFCFSLYKYSDSIGTIKTEEKVLGVLMALTALFGKAFNDFGSTIILVTSVVQIVKTVLIFAGYLMFFTCAVKTIRYYFHASITLNKGFDIENPVKYQFIVFGLLIAIWSVHVIGYYPGMFMGDTEDIIYMAYNYHTVWADTVELISDEVLLVDHHSVLYTYILGFFVKLGRFLFNSENIGLFIYTLFQAAFTAWVLAYSLYKLKKYGVSAGIRTVIFLFFAFFPWIPRYAIMATKDTLFADLMMLYLLTITDVLSEKDKKISVKNITLIIVYAVLMFLLRKNGLYVTILSLPFLLMINKKWLKQIIIACVCIFLSQILYADVILPAAKITDGSVSAALSVPLQQTSRYLHYFGDEVTEEEKEAIDAVVNYETVSNVYWPDRSDWAKYAWRKEATGEEMKEYFITWFKMLCKKPLTYVAATAHNCYGYFYPVILDLAEFEVSNVGAISSTNRDGYFNFEMSHSKFSMFFRDVLKLSDTILMRTPLLNIICTSAFYIWILIFVWTKSIVSKDRKTLMLVVPMLMLMLTILTGPCNGNIYHRFTYPVAMCIPVIAAYSVKNP